MPAAPLSIRDYATYLIGNRQAILSIATTRGAVAIGALLVLSAAFAREYDGEDLRAEPWHLLIPFGASLATSFVLFSAVWLAGRKRRAEPMPFWKSYRGFLSLYWATAPLAWLYAIPVERFLPVMAAVQTNYAILLVVSLWRIALITRAIAITNSCSIGSSLSISVLVSLIVALIAEIVSPTPIANIMSGVRIPPDERLASDLFEITSCISIPAFLIALIAALMFVQRDKPWRFPQEEAQTVGTSRALKLFALASVIAWVPLLPGPQREQKLRQHVEIAFEQGRFAVVIAELSIHSRSDYPPHWRPPPRMGHDRGQYDTFILYAEALRQDAPKWVRDAYQNATMAFISPGVPSFDSTTPQFEALIFLVENDDAVRQALSWLTKRQAPNSQPSGQDELAKAIIYELRAMSINR